MGHRILIADDDIHTRRILETLLSREPALTAPSIVCVPDGQEALAAVENERFDVVVTDLLMPKMDGFAFARAMRQHAHGQGVPLLVTSAIYKDRVSLGRLEQDTACEFYAKPHQLRDLVRAAVRHLTGTTPRTQPSRIATRTGPAPNWLAAQEGELRDRPLPKLLLELFDAEATGVLTIKRARLKKDIFLFAGHPIGADSNLRNETLGQMLLARGALEPLKLQQALELSRTGHHPLGAILVEKGWMKESEVLKYLAAQVRLKIVTALRWPDGEYRFVAGDSFSGRMTHLTVDAPRTVFAGLKRSAHLDDIVQGAAASAGRLVVDARFERHREAFTRVFGDARIPVLLGRPRPPELAARGDSETLVQYDALLLTGLASVDAEAAAPPPVPVERGTATRARAVAPPPPPVDPSTARAQALYRHLFGDEESGTLATAAPSVDFTSTDDSGVFTLPPAVEASNGTTRATTDPEIRTLHDALLREYLTVHSRDHYQILRVARTATQQEIARAWANRREEFRIERFQNIDLGRDHARLDTLHQAFQEAYAVLSDPTRRAAYDRSLDGPATDEAQPEATAALEAEPFFREAVRLLSAGRPDEAVPHLREATRLAPDQADYHAMLGWALALARDPQADLRTATEAARAELAVALSIDPDHAAAHEFTGRLRFALGDDAAAAEHLEKALQLEAGRPEALAAAAAVYLRMGDHERLEHLYRGQIARLGGARAARLWWDLALLLRDHRDDREGAIAAMESYLRLVPDDARAAAALARLQGRPEMSKVSDIRKSEAALRAAWRATPADPTPGRALFRLYLREDRPDAALAAAGGLLARNAGDAEAEAFARRYRPHFLQRAAGPLAGTNIDAIRHPDDDRELLALFTRLFEAAPPDAAVPAGAEPLAPEAVPAPFAQVLAYVTWLLDVPGCIVRRNPEAGALLQLFPPRAAAGDPNAPVLVAGPAVLALADKLVLAFRLGRALAAALHPARTWALLLPSHHLKAYLSAASALVAKPANLEPEAARLGADLKAVPRLADEVRPMLVSLSSRGAPLNLSRWVRGLGHTADRVGLVACNDLPTAAGVLAQDGVPAADLVDFALSDEMSAVREALGLTLAV